MTIATSADWWMSTKSPKQMFRPAYQTDEVAIALKDAAGVDPAILAADLGICRNHIEACQRRLGLRKITGGGRKRKKKFE